MNCMRVNVLIQPMTLFLLMLICPLPVEAVENVLRLGGAVNRPPFEYVDQGQLKGINIDIAHAIFADMGEPIDIKLYSVRRLYNLMLTGSIDGSVVWNTGATLKNKVLVSQMYYDSKSSFYSLKERALKIQSTQDLPAYNFGYIGVDDSFLFGPKGINFNDHVSMVKSLLSERVDVIVLEDAIVDHVTKSLAAEKPLQRLIAFKSKSASFALSNQGLEAARAKSLLDVYNKSLLKLKKQGVIRDIIRKYSRLEHFSYYQ